MQHNTVALKTFIWRHQSYFLRLDKSKCPESWYKCSLDVDWRYKPTTGRLIQAKLSIPWQRNHSEAQSKDPSTCRLQGPGIEPLTLWLVDDGSASTATVTSGNQTPTWSLMVQTKEKASSRYGSRSWISWNRIKVFNHETLSDFQSFRFWWRN